MLGLCVDPWGARGPGGGLLGAPLSHSRPGGAEWGWPSSEHSP